MNSSLDRFRTGAVVLGVVFIFSVCGYRAFGHDWIEAIYLTVITIFSVGYGEDSHVSSAQQLFTIAVIVFGISAGGYTLGGIVQMLFEGEFERALGLHRMTREIDALNRHTVICGYGRIGQILSGDLKRHGKSFVVIEADHDKFHEARDHGYLCIQGDATQDEILIRAGVARAESLISALPNDAANVFITLTARNLSRDLQIISRAEQPSTETKLRQAGANRVVLPTAIGAQQMVRMITRPSTADLMDLIAQQGNLDLELDELVVPAKGKLIGVTVSASEAHREHHLLILAVKQITGKMIFHPSSDYEFQSGDVVIVLGDTENIGRFRSQYEL